ncbi:MAG TPA: aminoglycoside phosphotransferase family protein [Methanomicrobia archaeon]|nr:aminoglycoside phosphotransferase family protein [Methanomicrobia archaeon]
MDDAISAYLELTFGPSVKLLSVKSLGLEAKTEQEADREIKGFGYGRPYLVTFETGSGERREVVLSTMKGDAFGHDHFADRAGILLWQHHAFNTLPKHVRSLDVGYVARDGSMVSASDADEFFMVCEMVEGVEYVHDLNRLKAGATLCELDRERVAELASYLTEIHALKSYESHLYVRRLRELVGHSECIFGLTDSYPPGNQFITGKDLSELEKQCIDWRWKLKERTKRLCQVHGDFHPWNVLFREGTDFTVLDRSRGEWGEAADDVSSMAINYLFFGLLKTDGTVLDTDFKSLFELFFATYLEKTGDYELLRVIQPFFAFRGLVIASPVWYPDISQETRRKLFNFIRNVLDAEKFEYLDVAQYLEG